MAHAMGVAPERVGIDYTLARGLDYYTGPVLKRFSRMTILDR